MTDRVRLVEDSWFELSHESIAWRLDWPEAAVKSCFWQQVIPSLNANPALVAAVLAQPGSLDGVLGRRVLIDFEAEGTPCRDLTPALLRDGVAGPLFQSCGLPKGMMFIHSTSDIVHVPYDEAAPPRRLRIDRDIVSGRAHINPALRLRVTGNTQLIAQGNVVPVPLTDGGTDSFLAYLHLDLQQGAAKWSLAPEAEPEGLIAGALARLRGTGSGPLKQADLAQLRVADFPNTGLSEPVYFDQAMLRGDQTIVFSPGISGWPKTGLPFGAIAEIGSTGRLKRQIYLEDYTLPPDRKQRGFQGRFTSSGRYFIRRAVYQANDAWKGKPTVVDLETGRVLQLGLPKNAATAEVQDHLGCHFWAIHRQGDGTSRVLRLRDDAA